MPNALANIIFNFKSSLKHLIPEKHKYFIDWHIKHYGINSARREYAILFFKSFLHKQPVIRAQIPNSDTHLLLRATPPDLDTFHYIFFKREYEIECRSAEYIIDAGAHIGLASVFFSMKYPEAKILSIEPEDSNYELLVANTKRYHNIKTINAALWSHNTTVGILNMGALNWEYRVSDISDKNWINAISLEEAMSVLETEHIDILKMDIEGSEIEVFRTSGSWIDRIRFIILETHDRFRPGCTQAMDKAIEGHNFNKKLLDGNTLLTKNNYGT